MILEPGDALYIPSFWLHYIVSLGTNFQCNARSAHSEVSHEDVKGCRRGILAPACCRRGHRGGDGVGQRSVG